jgi:hypothetical protein
MPTGNCSRPNDTNWTWAEISRAAGWRRSWTCRSFRPPRTSSPWLSLRATRSRAYASGPRVGACRRTGLGCIRGRRVAVAVGCGESCGQFEPAVKTPRGAGPRWRPAPLSLAGFAVAGPLATALHEIAAACQTGEGHDVRGGFGDGGDARFKVPKPDQPQPLGASR